MTQSKVKSFPNTTAGDRPHATWKWKQLLKKMVIPGERIAEEAEDTDDADSMPATPTVGDTDTSDTTSPVSTRKALDEPSSSGMPQPSHPQTRSYGEAE